jgi:hypothetical protein
MLKNVGWRPVVGVDEESSLSNVWFDTGFSDARRR